MTKPLVWLDGEVKTPPFSKEGRLEAGYLLRRLQNGETLGLSAFETNAFHWEGMPRASSD